MSRPIADAASGTRHVFLRDMVLHARVGIYPHERAATQRVRINVDLGVGEEPGGDRLARVVDYEKVADAVRQIALAGHLNLVETLAERIAASCLQDPRVRSARVRVEKLDVFDDTFSAGVEVERLADRNSSTG
ncbi:MAG: dihydroneopterin aldolase [Acetobacteraceae bacterium]|nr:dihydroneopterin aldolase [Acetobacteraceae bacterium]